LPSDPSGPNVTPGIDFEAGSRNAVSEANGNESKYKSVDPCTAARSPIGPVARIRPLVRSSASGMSSPAPASDLYAEAIETRRHSPVGRLTGPGPRPTLRSAGSLFAARKAPARQVRPLPMLTAREIPSGPRQEVLPAAG
jgi:hypothetical protein